MGTNSKSSFRCSKSHIVSDYFFSSSFEGEINWDGLYIGLSNQGEIISQYQYNKSDTSENFDKSRDMDYIFQRLSTHAKNMNGVKDRLGVVKKIQAISKINY